MTTILLLGKTGQVGHELLQTLAPLGTLLAPSHAELDLANAESLRANWTYSSRRSNFVLQMLELARSVSQISVVDDQTSAPTWARAYAAATAAMLAEPARLREHSGVYNLSAGGQCTRYVWAERILETAMQLAGDGPGWASLARTTTTAFPVQAPRPLYTLTNNRKILSVLGIALESWDADLRKFMLDRLGRANR